MHTHRHAHTHPTHSTATHRYAHGCKLMGNSIGVLRDCCLFAHPPPLRVSPEEHYRFVISQSATESWQGHEQPD